MCLYFPRLMGTFGWICPWCLPQAPTLTPTVPASPSCRQPLGTRLCSPGTGTCRWWAAPPCNRAHPGAAVLAAPLQRSPHWPYLSQRSLFFQPGFGPGFFRIFGSSSFLASLLPFFLPGTLERKEQSDAGTCLTSVQCSRFPQLSLQCERLGFFKLPGLTCVHLCAQWGAQKQTGATTARTTPEAEARHCRLVRVTTATMAVGLL